MKKISTKKDFFRILKNTELKKNTPENIHQILRDPQSDPLVITKMIYKMQEQILHRIDEYTYRSFVQSDMYLHYVNRHNMSINNSSSSGSEEHSNYISRSSTLPTLNEDSELLTYGSNFGLPSGSGPGGSSYDVGGGGAGAGCGSTSASTNMPMALTRDALRATERRRLEMRPTR